MAINDVAGDIPHEFLGRNFLSRLSPLSTLKPKQVVQLSQRDRTAGWVSYGQKWKTVTGKIGDFALVNCLTQNFR